MDIIKLPYTSYLELSIKDFQSLYKMNSWKKMFLKITGMMI